MLELWLAFGLFQHEPGEIHSNEPTDGGKCVTYGKRKAAGTAPDIQATLRRLGQPLLQIADPSRARSWLEPPPSIISLGNACLVVAHSCRLTDPALSDRAPTSRPRRQNTRNHATARLASRSASLGSGSQYVSVVNTEYCATRPSWNRRLMPEYTSSH